MPDEACRLAKLEEKTDRMEEDICNVNRRIDTNRDTSDRQHQEILTVLQELKNTHSKQQGFIGGVVFVVGGITGVIALLFNKYF